VYQAKITEVWNPVFYGNFFRKGSKTSKRPFYGKFREITVSHPFNFFSERLRHAWKPFPQHLCPHVMSGKEKNLILSILEIVGI